MAIKLFHTSLVVVAALSGCAQAPMSSATDTAPVPVLAPTTFATFGKDTRASDQGAVVTPIAYSEKNGDYNLGPVGVVGEMAVVKGQIGTLNRSEWAGIGMPVSNGKTPTPQDLSNYRALKIVLSSPTVKTLRVRVAGDDDKIITLGCYPTFMQKVDAKPTEYIIPLSRFEPESFCGSNGRNIASTIRHLTYIEVADIDHQRNKPTELAIGRIDFVQ